MLEKIAKAFIDLGKTIQSHLEGPHNPVLTDAIEKSINTNPWFTREQIEFSLKTIAFFLSEKNVSNFINQNQPSLLSCYNKKQKIGVIHAGNIPISGFHDFFYSLIANQQYIGKLSDNDKFLLPALAELLINIEPSFKDNIIFQDRLLPSQIDVLIASCSNTTAKYLHYYFQKNKRIIRGHKNSIAILTGIETQEELAALGLDVFSYWGFGCRNVSKIFIPQNFDLNVFSNIWHNYADVIHHPKYYNNYIYYKTFYILKNEKIKDMGFFIFKWDNKINSPVSVVYVEEFHTPHTLIDKISEIKEMLQCVILKNTEYNANPIYQSIKTFKNIHIVNFGKAQFPTPLDFPDNINVIDIIAS